MLKLSLAQINPTIGDIDGNIALMRDAAFKAQTQGASLVIFPELSLTGYYPADLLDDDAFMQGVGRGIAKMLSESTQLPDLYWVIGAPTRRDGVGKRYHNSLLVLKAGSVQL